MPDNRIWVREAIFLKHPVHTLFFAVLSLNFYGLLVFMLVGLFAPTVLDQLAAPGEHEIDLLWRFQMLMQMAAFVHVSLWAQQVGAGPFAGTLAATQKWVVIALIAAPVINLLIQGFVFHVLMDGDASRAFSSETAKLMTQRDALGPIMIAALVIAAPLTEEVIYRGVGLGYLLARGIPVPLAVGAISLAFTVLHGQYTLAAMVAVFALGLFLGWLRVQSRSMLPPILAHMAINSQIALSVAASP